jgi:8-oxo-dGTP diphosphatase
VRAAAGILSTDGQDRVLLVNPTYKDHWDLPGGEVEPGETPLAAAHREVREELGIHLAIGRLLVVDYLPGLPGGEPLTAYVFAARAPHSTLIRVDGQEISGWDWCGGIARSSLLRTAPVLASRITHALAAHRMGATYYLENGRAAQ